MSSPSNNLPTVTSYDTLTSPAELSHLLVDPNSNGVVTEIFRHDVTASALLKQYTFLSHSIDRLNEELERHHNERVRIFNYTKANEHF